MNSDIALEYFSSGNSYFQIGDYKNAKINYERALKFNPDRYSILINYSVTLYHLKLYTEAVLSCKIILALNSKDTDCLLLLSDIYAENKKQDEAIKCINSVILLNPDNNSYKIKRAYLYLIFDNKIKAIKILKKIAKSNLLKHESFNSLGYIYYLMNDFDTAEHYFKIAINIDSNQEYILNYAKSLFKNRKIELAFDYFKLACSIDEKNYYSYYETANAYFENKEFELSNYYYNKAIQLNSKFSEAYNGLALALLKLNNVSESLLNFDKAILNGSNNSIFLFNKAVALYKINKNSECISIFKILVEKEYEKLECLNYLGLIYFKIKKYDISKKYFELIISIEPHYIHALVNLGNLYLENRDYSVSLYYFKKAVEINENHPLIFGIMLHLKMYLCEWDDFDDNIEKLKKKIRNEDIHASPPFPVLSLIDDPEIQLKSAISYANYLSENKVINSSEHSATTYKKNINRRIKIAYFSGDFKNHPITYLSSFLIKDHSRENFEIYGFTQTEKTKFKAQEDIYNYFDCLIDVRDKSDQEILEIIRLHNIFIVIDLSGFTENGRPELFISNRLAPVQITFLGYLGASGKYGYDYIISDEVCINAQNRRHILEKIVYLPNCFQPNPPTRKFNKVENELELISILENKFVYCCFNDIYKLTPHVFRAWMRILKLVKNSVLVLVMVDHKVISNIHNTARLFNIDKSRIIFLKRVSYDEYMSRYSLADIFLDTSPYNAGTTASDALSMGVPLITLQGNTFVSRQASSLLSSLGLNELIAKNIGEYVDMAVKLALNPFEYEAVKAKLSSNIKKCSLFDSNLYLKNLEKVFIYLHNNYTKRSDIKFLDGEVISCEQAKPEVF
jgi:protein O-GlcNAc transferase